MTVLLLFCALSPQAARAQQVVANGVSLPAGGTINTGSALPTAGYALWALNNGIITSTDPFLALITAGGSLTRLQGSDAVLAQSAGSIILSGGGATPPTATITTSGQNANALRADSASSISVTNMGIGVQGYDAFGAVASAWDGTTGSAQTGTNGGTITIHGGTIDTFGGTTPSPPLIGVDTLPGGNAVLGGTALYSAGGNSSITADGGLQVNMSGHGAYAAGPSTITLDNVTFTQQQIASTGAYQGGVSGLIAVSDLASTIGTINANNVHIDMAGSNITGVNANQGGVVNLTNSSVSTTGDSGILIRAFANTGTVPSLQSIINATNVTAVSTGANSYGVSALNSALITLNNVQVETHGAGSWGTDVQGYQSFGTSPANIARIVGTNVTINTYGASDWGLVDFAGGTTDLTDSSVTTHGIPANGLYVANLGSIITLRNSTVTSVQGFGADVLDSAQLYATNTSISGLSHAIISEAGGTTTNPNIVVVDGGSLTATTGDVFHAEDSISQLTLENGTIVTAGGGNLLNVISTDPATFVSIANFTASGITATGNIISDAASTATVDLINGTTITGIELNTFTTIDASSTWIMNGNSDIHSLTLAGQVLYTPPIDDPMLLASYKTLTTGSYVGQGGTIGLNTFLGDDSSPSDRLVINAGTATGSTFLHFTNTTGPGLLTTANGILVVDAINGATTAAGSFTMANPELRAGAFDYRLFQGGLNGSDPNNWYLRSTMIVPPIPPTPPEPIIGPELATYGVVQPMAQQLGRAMLGTHDDRFGDLYPVPCEPAETNVPNYTKAPVYTKAPTTDCSAYGWRPAVWGRLFGQQIDNHYQAFADPSASGQIAGLQAGIDLFRSDSLIAGHTDYAGLYGAYGNVNVDVSGLVTNAAATANVLQHTGHLNLNAYSGGAYWTHYGVPGWYLDLTLQGTSYGGAASTEFARLNTTGSGFISSLEGGYPIALPQLGPGFVLEPQAQVLWQWVSFDAGNDGLGPVALGTTSETTARVGLKGRWTITTDSGQVWQPYLRANFWSDFGGTAATLFGTDSIPLISHAQYMDVGGGFTTKIDTHFSAFADVGYQFAVSNDGGGRRNGVKASAGLRYQW